MNNMQAIALIYLVSSSVIICQATNSISPSNKTTHTHDIPDKQDSPAKECNTFPSESTCNDKNTKSEKDDIHINAQDVTKEVNNTEEVNNINTLQNNQSSYEHDADEKEKEIVQYLLHNVANIAGNFFNIVAAPNDPQNVGNSIAGMLSGMINIAVQAFKSGELNLDADHDSIEQFTKNLSNKLKNEMSRLIAIKARSNNCS